MIHSTRRRDSLATPASLSTGALLALVAALSLAACGGDDGSGAECGEGTRLVGGVCEVDPNSTGDEPAHVTHLRLLHAAIVDPAPHQVLYPVDVAITIEIAGDPLTGDLMVAFVTPDQSQGCLLGSLHIEHLDTVPEGEIGTYTAEDRLVIPEDCETLLEEPVVELAVAFDPLGLVEVEGYEAGEPIFLGLDECVTCEGNDGMVALAPHDGAELLFDRFAIDTTVLRLYRHIGADTTATAAEQFSAYSETRLAEAGLALDRCVETGMPSGSDHICREFYGLGLCPDYEYGEFADNPECARCDQVVDDPLEPEAEICGCRILGPNGSCLCSDTRAQDGTCAQYYVTEVCGEFEDGEDCVCASRRSDGFCLCAVENEDGTCACPFAARGTGQCPQVSRALQGD
ncbi:MAG: hypothetical protein KC561_13230, partial [Myxococcales bacterium]|nr:hypothetical protein [Myxococcales bacterium]